MPTRNIFISVAEDSADMHAAALVRTARERLPGCAFYGLTGPRLRSLGVRTVYDLTAHAAMLAGIVGNLRRGWLAVEAAIRAWEQYPPDLVILLDASALHLPMARAARRRGLRVLYYIAPQTWASRAYRNRRLAEDVERVACILPFEESHFRRALVHATYVGHPLFETLRAEQSRDDVVQRLRSSGHPVVAILPGSRRHVIDTMLPLQLEVVRRMRAAGHVVQPVVSCVSNDRQPQVRHHVNAGGFAAEVVTADNASLLTAADLVLAASGTATLHAAYYRKPMVVMYHAGRVLRWPYRLLGRYVIRTRHLSLVNVLAQARIVPEFMPFITDTRPVAAVAGQLLTDSTWRQVMTRQLGEVVSPLENTRASENVCAMMQRMLGGGA